MAHHCFPFTAVVGQDRIKTALILNAVNPHIGGVLISGEKGTAKSTLVRGLADIIGDTEVIDLPLNITEDRLIGSIDIEAAITQGKTAFEPGLLEKADGNILYVDEINLLSEHITNCLLEVAASGTNIVEREGISFRHSSEFILVGTMNPEEGMLRPQITDRFGLYTEVHGEPEPAIRTEIIRRRLTFENNATEYRRHWEKDNQALSGKICNARNRLSAVQVTDETCTLAAELAAEANCAGHRAELVTIETARAIAAFDMRTAITEEDIIQAAEYALPHRMRDNTPVPPPPPPPPPDTQEQPPEDNQTPDEKPADTDDQEPADMPPMESSMENSNESDSPDESPVPADSQENIDEPEGNFDIELTKIRSGITVKTQGAGKRARVKTDSRQGRYVRYRFPKGKVNDLAFDATLRAAAPFQASRAMNDGLRIHIRQQDIREKMKEKHTGCIVLFVVDASGSMGAMKRMAAVKGAVLSLLEDAYRKRDRVGVIAFRDRTADTLLGITRSIDLAYKCLKELPTGGKTPMAAGLARGYELLKTAAIRETDALPYLVLVSDGKTNVPLNGTSAMDDALKMASLIRNDGIRSMVLDTEEGFIRLGMAKKISEALDAEYIKMANISAMDITSSVKQAIL